MAAVTASLVVSFGGGAGESLLVAELDDVKNNGNTSFLTSDTCYFSIYKYPGTLLVNTPVPTSGMVTSAGTVSYTKTENLEFVNTKSVALSYPPDGIVIVSPWYGNEGQDFTINGYTATITSDAPCICKVSYSVSGESWQLHPPNNIDTAQTPQWPITVFILGESSE